MECGPLLRPKGCKWAIIDLRRFRMAGVKPYELLWAYEASTAVLNAIALSPHSPTQYHRKLTSFCRGVHQMNVQETIYRNYQKITLQESPGSVPAGRLPRHKEVVLLNDLIDQARPGEQVEITGAHRRSISPVAGMYLLLQRMMINPS